MGSGQSTSEATETPTQRPVTPPLPQFLLDRPVTPAPPGPDDLDQRGGWGDDFSLQGKIDDELNAPSPTKDISETDLNRKNESLDKDIDKALKETDLLVNEDEQTKTCQDQINHKNGLAETHAELLSKGYQNQLTNLSSEGGESPRLISNSRNTSVSTEKDPEYDFIMTDKRVLVDKTTEDWVLASQEIEGFDPQKFAEANKKNAVTDAVKVPSRTESSWDWDDENIDEIMKPTKNVEMLYDATEQELLASIEQEFT